MINNVIAAGDSGLSNRLKVLIYSIYRYGSAYLNWKIFPMHVDANANEILSYPRTAYQIPFTTKYITNRFGILSNAVIVDMPYFYVNADEVGDDFEGYLFFDLKSNSWRSFNSEMISIDLLYNLIPENIKNQYASIAIDLLKHYRHYGILKKYTGDFFSEDVLGIHVRTWYQDSRREGLFDLDQIFRIIDSNPRKYIYLSSDNLDISNHIIEMRPNIKIFKAADILPDTVWRQLRKFMTTSDMADLVLLSFCKTIYGSYLSTFSEMAWYFSGCNSDIKIILPDVVLNNVEPFSQNLITQHPNYVSI